MKVAGRILLVLAIALTSLSAMSPERADQTAGDDEIRIELRTSAHGVGPRSSSHRQQRPVLLEPQDHRVADPDQIVELVGHSRKETIRFSPCRHQRCHTAQRRLFRQELSARLL